MSTDGPQPTQGAPKKKEKKRRKVGRLFFGIVFLSLVFFFFFFGGPLLVTKRPKSALKKVDKELKLKQIGASNYFYFVFSAAANVRHFRHFCFHGSGPVITHYIAIVLAAAGSPCLLYQGPGAW
jgi:hypothetical protein